MFRHDRRRQHFGRILQRTGRRDDVARRHRHREIVVAEVEIELALAEIRLDVPAAYVVVHRDTRVPLRDFVQRAIAAHAIGAMLGHEKAVRHFERRDLARRQRLSEIDFQHRLVVAACKCGTARCLASSGGHHLVELREVVPALEATRAETRVLREDERVERVVAESVLLGLQPDVAQRIGRIVRVAQRHLAAHRLGRRVERGRELVVGAILPIASAGRAAAGPHLVCRRQRERCEDRGIGDGKGAGRVASLLGRELRRRDGRREGSNQRQNPEGKSCDHPQSYNGANGLVQCSMAELGHAAPERGPGPQTAN